MIEGGYILMSRKIDESEVSKMSPVTRELFIYLLRKVNHAPFKNLRRGQGHFVFSNIQSDLSWKVGYRTEKYSKPQISKALRRLKNAQMIETVKATRGLIITICNYDFYQNPKNYEGNNEGNKTTQRRKHEGVQDIQEGKNDKELHVQFNAWWVLFDKKRNKEKCINKWKKLNHLERELALEHTRSYVISTPDKQFRKDPVTYLNNAGWNDEIVMKNEKQKTIGGFV